MLEVHPNGSGITAYSRDDMRVPASVDKTHGFDFVVLMIPNPQPIYVRETGRFNELTSFTLELTQAARFSPEPAESWLKELLPHFPTMVKQNAHEHRLLMLKK